MFLVSSSENPEGSREAVTVRRLGDQVLIESPPETATTVNGAPIETRVVLVSGDRVRVDSADAEILVVTMAD